MNLQISNATLIELNNSRNSANVFCLHTAGGGVSYYEGLAKQLVGEAKFFGLDDPSIYDDFEFRSIPELAEYHVDTIKSVQESGPYILFGYCSGGPLAYEVANQLALCGDTVKKLAIFGSSVVGFDKAEKEHFLFLKDYLSNKFSLNLEGLNWKLFETQGYKFVIEAIIDHLIEQQVEGVNKEADWIRLGIRALYLMRCASKKYSPARCTFDIDLFDRYLDEKVKRTIAAWCDWNNLTTGNLNWIEAPELKGGHTDILFPPYLKTTVSQIRDYTLTNS